MTSRFRTSRHSRSPDVSIENFLAVLAEGCAHCDLRGRRVVLAVSGGADSVALLRGMLELRDAFQLDIIAAHFDHRLRTDSGDVARWVEQLCATLQVPLISGAGDVLQKAHEAPGEGIEAAARRLRYDFLREAARDIGASAVLVAHTREDQAETILHQILRGTGPAGLRGMPYLRDLLSPVPERVQADEVEVATGSDAGEFQSVADSQRSPTTCWLARPLLNAPRESGREFLKAMGQDFREDPMNTETRYTRARIRHQLLPLLSHEYNPRIVQALTRLGEQATGMQAGLEFAARQLLPRAILHCDAESCRLARAVLGTAPRSVVRECFSLLWKQQNWPRRAMGFDEWNRLADCVMPPLSTWEVAREGTWDPPRVQHIPGHVIVEVREGLLLIRRTGV